MVYNVRSMTPLLSETLTQHKEALDRSMLAFLDGLDTPSGSFPRESLRSIRDFVTRGKGIRGSLFLHAVSLLGQDRDAFMRVAVSLELMHAGLLIQDDVMDRDVLRRGRETVFGKLRHAYNDNLAGSLSFLTGDICFFLADKALLALKADDAMKLRLLEKLNEEITQVNFAQMNDVLMGQEKTEPDLAVIESVYLHKTARYTFSLPLSLAGMAAGQADATIAKMEKFGEHAGFLFQLRDDELSLYGDEKVTGKQVGNDIRENKKTIIRHFLFSAVTGEEKKLLSEIFGASRVTPDDLTYVRNLIVTTGVASKLERVKKERMEAVEGILGTFTISQPLLLFLRELASFALKRSK